MTAAILKQFKSESGFVTGPESNFGAITATQLDVDNIRINANSITATNASGNINLVTTGTGSVVIDKLAVNTVNAFAIAGNLTGNVLGNVTGNLTGNVTGNVTGNIISVGASAFTNVQITGGSVNAVPVGQSTPAAGKFTSLISTTGITGSIGATTKNTGQFTFLQADNAISALSVLESNDTTSGSLVVSGGVGIAKNVNIGGTLTVAGPVTADEATTNTQLTTKFYVDRKATVSLAFAVAFGL
jgi:hypothetical protein